MDRTLALNIAAYIFLAVTIILTALTAWGIIKSEKDKNGNEEGE